MSIIHLSLNAILIIVTGTRKLKDIYKDFRFCIMRGWNWCKYLWQANIFFEAYYQQMKWMKQEITSYSLAAPSKQENQSEDTSSRYNNIHNRISFIMRHVYPNLSARILSVVWKEGVGGVPWLRQLHTFGVKISGGLHEDCSSYLPKQAINLDVTCQLDPRWTLKCHLESAWQSSSFFHSGGHLKTCR